MLVVLTGRIGRPHALRGELQVRPFNAGSDLWQPGAAAVLLAPEDVPSEDTDVVEVTEAEAVELRHVRPGPKGRLLVTLDGVEDRTAAEQLRGWWLAIPTELLDREDDEFFFYEVPGWAVETPDGAVAGTVVRAIEGATDLLEVRPARGGPTFFVPVVASIVVEVDRTGKRFVVDPPEGLLP